jgi:hypothetical protein
MMGEFIDRNFHERRAYIFSGHRSPDRTILLPARTKNDGMAMLSTCCHGGLVPLAGPCPKAINRT